MQPSLANKTITISFFDLGYIYKFCVAADPLLTDPYTSRESDKSMIHHALTCRNNRALKSPPSNPLVLLCATVSPAQTK